MESSILHWTDLAWPYMCTVGFCFTFFLLAGACGTFVARKAHRQLLFLVALGLFAATVVSCISGSLSYFKSGLSARLANEMQSLFLHVLVGPSLACISLARLILCINYTATVTMGNTSKATLVLSSRICHIFLLLLAPIYGLTRHFVVTFISTEDSVRGRGFAVIFDGLEFFWDMGCCLLFVCVYIMKCVASLPSPSSMSLHAVREPKKCFGRRNIEARQVHLIASNDGYLLANSTSVLARLTILIYPTLCLEQINAESVCNRNFVVVVVYGLVVPLLLMCDLHRQAGMLIGKCCCGSCKKITRRKVAPQNNATTNSSSDNSSTVIEMTSLGSNNASFPPTKSSSFYSRTFRSEKRGVVRSISYSEGSGRCALGSILGVAPMQAKMNKYHGNVRPLGKSNTTTWTGPLDEAMEAMVGQKYLPNDNLGLIMASSIVEEECQDSLMHVSKSIHGLYNPPIFATKEP